MAAVHRQVALAGPVSFALPACVCMGDGYSRTNPSRFMCTTMPFPPARIRPTGPQTPPACPPTPVVYTPGRFISHPCMGRTNRYSMFLPPAGHCFPATGSGVNSANYFACPWIGSAAYDWGREVVRFFERNRCPVSVPSPTPPPPTPPPVSVSPFTSWGGKIFLFSSADCADGTEISLGRSNVFDGNVCQEDFGLLGPTTKIGLVCSSDLSTVVACSGTNADGSTAAASCTAALGVSWVRQLRHCFGPVTHYSALYHTTCAVWCVLRCTQARTGC